jgi:spoIIIJ-associated protein
MSTSIEAQGHTVDEAIQIALNQLGVSRDKVEIDILHHPRRGVLGIGARRAKVRATIREAVMPDGEEFDMSGGEGGLDDKPRRRRRRGGRNRGRGEEGEQTTAPRPAPGGARVGDDRRGGDERRPGAREGQPPRGREDAGRDQQRVEGGRAPQEGGRGRDDRRGGRGRDQRPEGQGQQGQRGRGDQPRGQQGGQGRDARGQQVPGREGDPRGQQGQQRTERGERRDQQGRGQQQGRRERDPNERRDRGPRSEPAAVTGSELEATSFDASQTESAPREAFVPPAPRRAPVEEVPLDAEALDAIRTRAEELVRELLEKMGFPAEVSSSVDETAGEAVVSVRSESEGLLIGRRGQTLDSLEHIVNRMTLRADAYVEGRVLLDIGDYRKRRRESLDELATRLRARAVTERRTVQVSPMSPRDRKFFAQAFAGDESVEVRALGAGFYRRVIVAPAGAGPGAIAEAETAVEIEDDSLENETFAGGEAES